MPTFRSRRKGKNRKVYPLTASRKRARLRRVSPKSVAEIQSKRSAPARRIDAALKAQVPEDPNVWIRTQIYQ